MKLVFTLIYILQKICHAMNRFIAWKETNSIPTMVTFVDIPKAEDTTAQLDASNRNMEAFHSAKHQEETNLRVVWKMVFCKMCPVIFIKIYILNWY